MDGAASFGVTDAGGENPATDDASPNWNIDGGWGGPHVVPLSPVCGVAMGSERSTRQQLWQRCGYGCGSNSSDLRKPKKKSYLENRFRTFAGQNCAPSSPPAAARDTGRSKHRQYHASSSLTENAILPVRGSKLAAGYDLSAEAKVAPAHGKALVKTDGSPRCSTATRASPRARGSRGRSTST